MTLLRVAVLVGALAYAGASYAQTATNTPVPPTATNTPTVTPTITGTPTSTPSITQTPTKTLAPSRTPTNTPTITLTPVPSATNTPAATSSPTQTGTPTPSSSPTITLTSVPTNTKTPTLTPTPTVTNTPLCPADDHRDVPNLILCNATCTAPTPCPFGTAVPGANDIGPRKTCSCLTYDPTPVSVGFYGIPHNGNWAGTPIPIATIACPGYYGFDDTFEQVTGKIVSGAGKATVYCDRLPDAVTNLPK